MVLRALDEKYESLIPGGKRNDGDLNNSSTILVY